MKNRFRKILLLILLSYLPFFLLITYSHFSNKIRVLDYSEKVLFLFLGPLKLAEMDSRLLYLTLDDTINYISLVSLTIMVLLILISIWKFNQAKLFKILFCIGMIIWFLFGFVAIGIHYITT